MTIAGVASGSGTDIPADNWRPTADVGYAVSMGEMRGKINTATVQLKLEYANDVRSSAGTIAIGNTISANGMLDPTTPTDISTLRAYRFCRPAWYLWL